jgi:predicted GNAT family N-acyltransferase
MTINEANYQDVLKLRHSVMYPDKDIDHVKLDNDDMGIHMGVFEAGELMTVVSIFMDKDRNVQFRKLATRTDMQGKGYASAMINWLIDYANDVKLNGLWCNARKDATGFYEKFGFEKTDKTFSKDGHDFVVMQRKFQ